MMAWSTALLCRLSDQRAEEEFLIHIHHTRQREAAVCSEKASAAATP
jgi:hypothetical protein